MRRLLGILLLLFLAISLNSCDNTTGTRVTYGDARSSNALLSELSISDGFWEYDFNKYDRYYDISVSNEVSSIKVKPKTERIFSTVTINGSSVKSGAFSDSIPLSIGSNTITVVVTAWDLTTNTYTLTVIRKLSAITSLKTLAITKPVDVQIANAGNNNYTAVVGTSTEKISFNIETTHPDAVLEMKLAHNGEVTTGSDITINNGLNSFLIKITAADGITKEYFTAEITKLSGDTTDCKVNSFSIQNTHINPSFDVDDHNGAGSTFTFSAEISSGKLSAGETITNLMLTTNSGASSVLVTDHKGTTNHSGGQVAHQLNQADFPSRTEPYVITTAVTSGDTNNTTTYVVNLLVREGNNDATLADGDGLIVTWGEHNSRTVVYPGTFENHNPRNYQFSSNLYEYIAIVAGTETVTIKTKVSDPNAASIIINGTSGTPDANGEFSSNITLTKGYITTVTIDVKAEDNNTIQSYTLKIKLLNVYEYYWGIYVPVNNASYRRQFDWKETHGLIFDDTMNDYTGSGTLRWKTEMTPSTHMWWNNYNDGNTGSTSYNVRTDYNYNHPTDSNMDGFVLNGETYGKLESITNKDGFVYGGFLIDTPWGDRIMDILCQYWIDDQEKIDYDDCSGNSFVEVVYMGEFYKIKYEVNGIPYPFTDSSFDWAVPWVPNNILSGYPTAVPAGWSWNRDL